MKTNEKTDTAPALTTERVDTVAIADLKTVTGGCAACGGTCGGVLRTRRWR